MVACAETFTVNPRNNVNINVESYVVDQDEENPLPLSTSNLSNDLKRWSLNHNISHVALDDLLKLMIANFPDTALPTSSKTLLGTPRHIAVKYISGGQYYYFGVEEQIRLVHKIYEKIFINISQVTLTIGCDGFPIYNSSSKQMWPILIKIDQISQCRPLLAGLFCGDSKPSNLIEYLNQFTTEIDQLQTHGIYLGDKQINFSIRCFICDAPARSFLKCTKGHSGYNSCERCDVHGDHEGHIIFPTIVGNLRTNLSFRSRTDPRHHHADSPLLKLNVDLVSGFVLDYMHLVCLGVMRKLINLWLSGPLKCRISTTNSKQISEYLIKISSNFPDEFARRPRSLIHVNRFKATEFRQLLLYTGPCAFRSVLPDKYFRHYLLLHTAMYILLSKSANNSEWNSFAKSLLLKFVTQMSELYGSGSIVYNVHSLLHIADDALKFGSLDNISAFEFESHLCFLKKAIRGNNLPLQQVVKRVKEWEACVFQDSVIVNEKKVKNEPNKNEEFKKFRYRKYIIGTKMGNNCFLLKNNDLVIVNRIYKENCKVMIECKKFTTRTAVKIILLIPLF